MIDGIIIQKAKEAVIISYANGIDITLYSWQLIVIASVAVAFALTVYLLMGFGLYRMAVLRGIDSPWLGFFPFVRLYLLGVIAGESRFFGWKVKNAGTIAMSLSMATFLLGSFCKMIQYLPILMILREGGTVVFEASARGALELVFSEEFSNFQWSSTMLVIYQVCNYLDYFLDIALIFVNVMLYMDLFKKYAPAHYLLYSLLAVLLPIGDIFVFCLRNNPAVNYGDYIKERYIPLIPKYLI